MNRRRVLAGMGAGAALLAMGATQGETQMSGADVVYELRVYTAVPGKLDALLARFRDHTVMLFKKHGLESIAYWTPTEAPLEGTTLIYILRHPSREAATKNWAAFHDDEEWKRVSAASEVNGKLTTKVESTFMKLTDFSAKVG